MKHPGSLISISFVLFAGTMWADIVPIVNPGFTYTPCPIGYQYSAGGTCTTQTSGNNPFPQQDLNNSPLFDGWTFGGGSGVTEAGTAFNPPTPFPSEFTQAAFLQGAASSVSQLITAPEAGNWTVSFYLAPRDATGSYDGNQTVQVKLGSDVLGTYAVASGGLWETITTAPVYLGAGPYALTFTGLTDGDHTAFVSDVSANVHVPEASGLSLLFANLLAVGIVGVGMMFWRRRAA